MTMILPNCFLHQCIPTYRRQVTKSSQCNRRHLGEFPHVSFLCPLCTVSASLANGAIIATITSHNYFTHFFASDKMTYYPNRHRRHLPCRPRFSSSALLSPLLLLPPLLPRPPLHQHPPPPLLPPPLPPPPPPPPHPAHGRRHLRPRLLVLSPGPPRLGGGGGGGLPVCRHAVEAVPRQEGVEAYQLQKTSARIPAQLKSVKLVNN